MKKTLLLATAAVLFSAPLNTLKAQENQTITVGAPQPYIEVTGLATTRVTPNKIEIAIRLSEADSKGKITLATLEANLAKALREAGIDAEEKLVVTDQSSNSTKRQGIYQYKNYLLTLASGAEVATLFAQLEVNTIANAEVISTDRTDMKEILQKTKAAAILDAQTTARVLTGAIGQEIGRAILIQDYSSNPPILLRGNTMMQSKIAGLVVEDSLSDVEFQDIRVEQRVTVRFELK